MRLCLVYDCLYPSTVGGAERWYRNLSEHLAVAGHEVTYLTMRQWEHGDAPVVPGVRVLAVAPRMALYTAEGRRRILPPLVFGAGVLWHLLRRGARYEVVHTASFPYFSLLAVAAARALHGFGVVVDWFEVWTRDYWREYLGRAGAIGAAVQRLCARLGDRAFCFSRLHAERLRREGFGGPIDVLAGIYAGPLEPLPPMEAQMRVVFAGRHIPEKRVPAVVPAVALARQSLPALEAAIFGDGPERERVLESIAAAGLGRVIEAPGFVDGARVEEALASALCMVLPSRREGYGLVVVEAAAKGTPSVVVGGPDNAATELVADGENGVIAASSDPADLAAAIVRVHASGPAMRASTAAWFRRNAARVSVEGSLATVLASYRRDAG